MRGSAHVIIVVADALVPDRRQGIGVHHDDSTVNIRSGDYA